MARDKDSITPVKIPPKDDGKTTFCNVCHFEAPKAKEASFKEGGTAFIASRVATIMIGSISNESVKAPDKILPPKPKKRTKIPKPNSP